MTKPIGYYCDQRKAAIRIIEERFGSMLQRLNRFEKCQLLAILSLTLQEIEERAEGEYDLDFTPYEANDSLYPCELSDNVNSIITILSEEATDAKDYLALCEALIAQLRYGR